MNAARLLALAAAHHVDLQHVAATATETGRTAGKGQRQQTVRGRESRSYRRPGYSIAEIGQAACGLGPVPWAAAMLTYAGDQGGFWLLWSVLLAETHRIGKREAWPARVPGEDGRPRFFREDLAAALILVEENHPSFFLVAPQLRAHFMKVSLPTWDKELAGPFKSLRSRYDSWLATARCVIGRWICQD